MALRKGFANNLFCPRCQQAANDGHPEMGQLLDEVCSLFKHNAHTAVFEKVARIRELDRSNVLMKLTLFMTGYAYFHGLGVTVNDEEADRYFREAHEAGHYWATSERAYLHCLKEDMEFSARILVGGSSKTLPMAFLDEVPRAVSVDGSSDKAQVAGRSSCFSLARVV